MIATSVVCRLGPTGGKDTVYVQQAPALGQRMLPDAQMEARVTRVLRMSRCRSGTQIQWRNRNHCVLSISNTWMWNLIAPIYRILAKGNCILIVYH